jgi:hypothetical protein
MAKLRRNLVILSVITVGLLISMASLQTAQAIRFYLPGSDVVYGEGYVGVIHVKIDTNADNTPDKWIETYCVTENLQIYIGNSYDADINPAPDNSTNRAVAFILTWWHMPGTYVGDPGYVPAPGFSTANAASVQRAIWQITDNYANSGDALTIATDATGKDVVKAGDILTLTSISQGAGSATLKAKLTLADAVTGHANVMVVFKLTGVNSVTGLNPVSEWNLPALYNYGGVTDVNGEIMFTITYSSAPLVKVDAYTKGTWPNILDPLGGRQNLAPVAYGSTLIVKQAFFALPEYPLGGLLAIAACFGAFFVIKKRSKMPNPKLRA